jgi:hypothetical protein
MYRYRKLTDWPVLAMIITMTVVTLFQVYPNARVDNEAQLGRIVANLFRDGRLVFYCLAVASGFVHPSQMQSRPSTLP